MRRFSLSTSRGLGPGKQCDPLDLKKLMDLGLGPEARFIGAPIGLPNLIVRFVYFFLPDLEGAFAVYSDLTLDRKKQLVRWWLPVSKTDPAAKGCHRTWGCLCAPGVRCCPDHAAAAQIDTLDDLFPGMDPNTLPLFPDTDGQPVSEDNMQRTVEHLAERTDGPIKTVSGDNRFGRHVWRAMGAIELAEINVDVYRIRLLGESDSDVVMRYARMAPIKNITDHVRELQAVDSLGKVVKELRASMGELTDRFANMKAHVLDELKQEVKAREMLEAPPAEAEELVVNTRTGAHQKGAPEVRLTHRLVGSMLLGLWVVRP